MALAAYLIRSGCEVSDVVDEIDDDMLWNGSEEDGDVRRECEEGEGTDCEDEDSDSGW